MGNQRGLGVHLIFLSILLVATRYTCSGVENNTVICSKQERLALLKFKHSIQDPSGMLSSWVGNNCCRWKRIQCDVVTGSVESLHLRGDFVLFENGYLGGNAVNSSLTELSHLKYLDLSGNDFQGSPIPPFIGSLKQLSYLNLSYAGFGGIIPPHIGNLSNLEVLDLSSNYKLGADDMAWTSGLSSLMHLDLSLLDLSGAKNTNMVFYMNPSLKVLSLSYCGLSNVDLVSSSNFNKILPNIEHLDLSFNSFIGPLPGFLQTLTSLEFLDLSYNSFEGPVPESLRRLRFLEVLDLSHNQLTHSIPESIGKLAALIKLHLESNRLTGPIPTSLGKLVSLQAFSVSSNSLNGSIPVSVGQLSKLNSLDISNNSLEGVVFEAHFGNLSMLKHLDTSSNTKLTFNVSREWIPSFQLATLDLSSCNITNGFPNWLRNQRKLEKLILSNATMSGPLPTWLRKMPIIPFLDLSHNKLIGPLTNLPNGETFSVSGYQMWGAVFLENNLFNDSIPRSLCGRIDLAYLDLSRNMLVGMIPECLRKLHRLLTMRFSSNGLSGVIPSSIAHNSSSLIWLSLNDNNLIGEIPQELGNLRGLRVLDLGENKLSGIIPEWIGVKFASLVVLRLHQNNFTGGIPRSVCNTSNLQILDVAYNSLTGTIPHCLGELDRMVTSTRQRFDPATPDNNENVVQVMKGVNLEYTKTWDMVFNIDLSSNQLVGEIPVELTSLSMLVGLNLSNNHLSGRIPSSIGNMTEIFSLDLSRNELIGTIPPSMAALTFLSHLNLSHNNLSGRIPSGNQLQTLDDPSIYIGNKDLCGPPLTKSCSIHKDPTIMPKKKDKEADETEVWMFYLGIVSGFATGFWGLIGVLLFKNHWRKKLFMFAEKIMDKIYVALLVRIAKMNRAREAV